MSNKISLRRIKSFLSLRRAFPHVIARERSDRSNLNKSGFSLIELMVAVAILAMVSFGIFQAFSTGFMGMTDAKERTVATNMAQKVMEAIKNNNTIEDEYPSETISGKIFNITATEQPNTPKDDLTTVTVTVDWLDRKENTKNIELEMIFYNLLASAPAVEVGTIELSSDPISSEVICCDDVFIIATVNDSEGDPVPNGVVISFSVTSGTGVLSTETATTTGGVAQVTLTLIDQSFITVEASSGEISGTIDIDCTSPTFVVKAESYSLTACEETVITATVNNFYNTDPIIGKSVDFSTNFGTFINGSDSISAPTNGSGEATVTLTSNTEGTASVNATYCGVTEYTGSINFYSPNIAIDATPLYLAICQTSMITATVTDDNGDPIIGKSVEFSTILGDLSSPSAITNENGQAIITLTSETAITTSVDATYCGVTETTDTISFTNPDISVTADPTTITLGNTSTITATIKDSSENLVADGTVVTFDIISGTGILSAYSATTTNGQTTITLTSDTEDTDTIRVQASYCGFSNSVDITILQHEYLFTLSSSVDEIEAGSPCVITATLTDRGIPVQGEIIDFITDSGTFSTSNNTTNADGQATVDLTFSVAEEGETATVEGVTTSLSPNIDGTTTVTCIEEIQTSDFKVIHGNSIIPSGSNTLTLTNGNDYTLEPGVTAEDCFVRIVNTRLTGIGRTEDGGNQNLDDFTVQISNPENILTSFNFERVGSSLNNCRVTWEIIQYIGAEGGANEIKVRTAVGGLSATNTHISVDGPSISNIYDKNKAVIYITGQSGSNTARGEWNECLFTAEFRTSVSGWIPRFTRGRAIDTGRVSYAVVEFTGSNWENIQRITFNSCGSTVTIPIPITLSDTTKTFLHCQYRYVTTANSGLDDCGETVEVFSTTQLKSRRKTSTGSSSKYHVVWVIENTQTTGNYMIVEHVSGTRTDNNLPEEHVWSEAINEVRALDEASIQGETLASKGTGRAYPRGSEGLVITSTTNLNRIQSDMGQDCDYAHCIVQFPTEE